MTKEVIYMKQLNSETDRSSGQQHHKVDVVFTVNTLKSPLLLSDPVRERPDIIRVPLSTLLLL